MGTNHYSNDHNVGSAIHLHKGGIDEQFIFAVFANDDNAVAIGNSQFLNQGPSGCVANHFLLLASESVFWYVGMKDCMLYRLKK